MQCVKGHIALLSNGLYKFDRECLFSVYLFIISLFHCLDALSHLPSLLGKPLSLVIYSYRNILPSILFECMCVYVFVGRYA